MSQEVKIEASGIITDEDDEDLQQDHKYEDQSGKQVNNDESIQNEESKIETNDDNYNKMQDESSQMTKHNFTSISKQIEDSDDINFHEESYNKEHILQNDERYEDIEQQHLATEEDQQAKRNQIFSKDQMNRQLSNAIIEASSNSSQFTIQFSQTDEVKSKKTFIKSYNNIGKMGVSGLGSRLAQCSNLKTLTINLDSNTIGENGAQRLGSGLAQCSNLQTLILNLRQKQCYNINY